jgi:hypothetical protein
VTRYSKHFRAYATEEIKRNESHKEEYTKEKPKENRPLKSSFSHYVAYGNWPPVS